MFTKLLILCNKCNIMRQIACTFFKNFPGWHPGPPFGAGTQNRAPSKILAARRVYQSFYIVNSTVADLDFLEFFFSLHLLTEDSPAGFRSSVSFEE